MALLGRKKDRGIIVSNRQTTFSFAQTFMKLGLIDEYRINVNPVVLGSGKPLFDHQADKSDLIFLGSTMFKGGVVGLRYAPGETATAV